MDENEKRDTFSSDYPNIKELDREKTNLVTQSIAKSAGEIKPKGMPDNLKSLFGFSVSTEVPEKTLTPLEEAIISNKKTISEKKPREQEPSLAEQAPESLGTSVGGEKKEVVRERTEKNTSIVRTYQSDVSHALKKQKTSVVSMAMAEHKKKERVVKTKKREKRKGGVFSVLSLFLFLIGVGSVVGVYFYINKEKPEQNIGNNKISSIVLAEKHSVFDIENKNVSTIISFIQQEIENLDLRLDYIENIYFVENKGNFIVPVSTSKFFGSIGSHMPSTLLRSFEDNFMFGIHVFNGNQPFLILKTSFYENAFAGMLEWERNIINDLSPIINPHKATSTNQFRDIVIRNLDARITYDQNNDTDLIYAFSDRNTIIITSDENTLKEILTRLNLSR